MLRDIAPDGTATAVTGGWQRASLREIDTAASTPGAPIIPCRHPQAVPISEPVDYRIPLVPNARRFAAGHRIQLMITSNDQPEDVPVFLGYRHAPVATNARNTVHANSRLLLPILTNNSALLTITPHSTLQLHGDRDHNPQGAQSTPRQCHRAATPWMYAAAHRATATGQPGPRTPRQARDCSRRRAVVRRRQRRMRGGYSSCRSARRTAERPGAESDRERRADGVIAGVAKRKPASTVSGEQSDRQLSAGVSRPTGPQLASFGCRRKDACGTPNAGRG